MFGKRIINITGAVKEGYFDIYSPGRGFESRHLH